MIRNEITEKTIRNMLANADFSQETDLKDRLRTKLFGSKVISLNSRRVLLDEDELDMISAAGEPVQKIDVSKLDD